MKVNGLPALRTLLLFTACVSMCLFIYTCSSDDNPAASAENSPDAPQETVDDPSSEMPTEPAGNDPVVMGAAFAPYSNVTTRFDDSWFYVESSGIPAHDMMVNITAWIAQVPLPQPYVGDNAWSIPLSPAYADNPISIETELQRGAIGIAANGIPIFNPLNASGLISKQVGELDDFGGHSGRADDYHYHTAPLHLEATSGTKPIAYAFDGFAVYGSIEPDGSPMEPLDEYHGHEISDGSYHYHGTDTYPYMVAAMRGDVTLDPMTTSPQTQIIPQARTKPLRDPLHGINSDDLIITDMTENSTNNGYLLEYTSAGVSGSVEYSWTDADLFTFVFNDADGRRTTETFQRSEMGDGAPPPDAPSDTPSETPSTGSSSGAFLLTSPAVADGELLDAFKCERKDANGIEDSIPLSWTGVPANATSLAIIMHHFPNPNDTSKANHYLLLWGIDPTVSDIPHGAADEGDWYMGSSKDGDAISYTSPCSQSEGVHEYTITIYALAETPASLPMGHSLDVTYDVLLAAISTVTVIDKGSLTFNDV